jgi:DNA-binding response OmpR family regulator
VTAAEGRKALVIEDESITASMVAEELVDAGFRLVGIADTADGATAAFARERPKLVIADVRLRVGDGISVARPMQEQGAAILFITAHCFDLVMESGVGVACLQKPFDPEIVGPAALAVLHYEESGRRPDWAPSELHFIKQ